VRFVLYEIYTRRVVVVVVVSFFCRFYKQSKKSKKKNKQREDKVGAKQEIVAPGLTKQNKTSTRCFSRNLAKVHVIL